MKEEKLKTKLKIRYEQDDFFSETDVIVGIEELKDEHLLSLFREARHRYIVYKLKKKYDR